MFLSRYTSMAKRSRVLKPGPVTWRRRSYLILICISWLLQGCLWPTPTTTGRNSWEAQLQIATREATRIDPEARLWEVIAGPVVHTQPADPIKIDLSFIRPSGEEVCVYFEDTKLEQTLEVNPRCGQVTPAPPAIELEQIQTALPRVKISPSQAVMLTLTEGRTLAERYNNRGIAIVGLQLLDEASMQRYGTPVAWGVTWMVGMQGSGVAEISLLVHPETGAILERREEPVTQTSSP